MPALTQPHMSHALPVTTDDDPSRLERAWAAGFLDSEGSFGLIHHHRRRRGPDWYVIRASASQNGTAERVPDVLIRLQLALGGVGRIERHGDEDDHKWQVEGGPAIAAIIERLGPWLGSTKRDQARAALDIFRRQVRLKGDDMHCVRGHEYDVLKLRGGRMRRICLACARINRNPSEVT
jgi:hypothetical protein